MRKRRDIFSTREALIHAYFEIDSSRSLEDHIQSVYEHWMKATNATYKISEPKSIRHLLDTLAPHEERIGKMILNEMASIIPLGNLHDVEFVEFCNALIEHGKPKLEMCSHILTQTWE
ncbi:hypothetical protein Adt_11861 [Abeliophyllum distichum]|uniref:NusB/RsmB/TIM44 domain-containing protein n=1 Tax=Abeliophyllum distichum TaxID=126358 RepID=A0ABD1UPE4_9LAMI